MTRRLLPESALGALSGPGGRCVFTVWAPAVRTVELHIVAPAERRVPMLPTGQGYFVAASDDAPPGTRYFFRLDDGDDRPDPASRAQPDGVHGPSEVVAADFQWSDTDWSGPDLEAYVIYELHVGTFTPEGTFEAIVPRLPDLASLGVTAIELMPVAQFPGERNWGYDGVYPFAVQQSYGGVNGLKTLVDACHRHGLAVVLDVVYNHIGPEGSYLAEFGPYFTDRYHTPWGSAINFDGAYSDEVRRYFIENALQWIDEFRIDALRLDAIHAILDTSARPFLAELADTVHGRAHALDRTIVLLGESDLGDPRVMRPAEHGGLGLDGQWADDFHHALHSLLTRETQGYYQDFGEADHLAAAFRTGFVYAGQYSRFRNRRHGAPPTGIRPAQIVVYSQNHDQVGNRLRGDRLSTLLSFEQEKLVAANVLLAPYTPLLFMGQEYGEPAPFPYFVSHSDPALIEAVRKGRREEFASFTWDGDPPDPQSEQTYRSAILDWSLRRSAGHAALLEVYRTLLALRREIRALTSYDRIAAEVVADGILVLRRQGPHGGALLALNLSPGEVAIDVEPGEWHFRFDSAAALWDGPADVRPDRPAGSLELWPHSAVLLTD